MWNLAIKKPKETVGEPVANEGLQELYAHIRLQFVANAGIIAENEKPERLLKMIQSCPDLKPVKRANKELWEIVEKVRRDLLGAGTTSPRKNNGKSCSRRKK